MKTRRMYVKCIKEICFVLGFFVYCIDTQTNILRLECKKNALFYHVASNMKINSKALDSFAVKNYQECLGHCLMHPKCRSINLCLREFNKTCSIHQEDRTIGQATLIKENGYYYYDTGYLMDKIGPVCREKSNPCINAKCFDQCDGTYNCVPYHGIYTISSSGRNFSTYCDMETEGGGWMLIGKVDVQAIGDASDSEKNSTDYILGSPHQNYLPSIYAMASLKRMFGFTQLRFYCHKEGTNKTVHIVTKPTKEGQAVLSYLTGATSVIPAACNSFQILPDDNSYLSRNCKVWGRPQSLDTWWDQNLFGQPMGVSYTAHFGFKGERSECDDMVGQPNYNIRGIWKFYAR